MGQIATLLANATTNLQSASNAAVALDDLQQVQTLCVSSMGAMDAFVVANSANANVVDGRSLQAHIDQLRGLASAAANSVVLQQVGAYANVAVYQIEHDG